MTEATAPSGTGDAGASAPSGDTSSAAPAAQTTTATAGESAAPAAAAPAPTLAAGGSPSGTPEAAAPAAPEVSWRQRIAGGDTDFLKTLDRYATEADFGKAYRAAQRKISEGAHKKPGPPEGATAADLAAWRKEVGLPDTPEGYKPQLANGLVLGTADKPIVDAFAQYAHQQNWTEQEFNSTLNWYYQVQDAQRVQKQDADQKFAIEAEDTLRREYGADYRRNMNALGNFRDKMPSGLSDRLLGGRLADGTLIGNDPQFIQWAIATALDMDPTSTLVPAGTTDSTRAIGDEISQIENLIRDPDKAREYWKDESKQARYRELLGARERMKTRAA